VDLSAIGARPGLDAGAVSSVPSSPGSTANLPNVSIPIGATSTVSPSGGGNSEVCEVQTVDSGRVTPDMLIVLDRSGSMRNNGVNRWDPSVSALKTLSTSLGGSINFGLMAFPGASTVTAAPMPTQDCSGLDLIAQIACLATQAAGGVATVDTCVAGSIDVPIAASNGPAIS
jgi:hypothetical protein